MNSPHYNLSTNELRLVRRALLAHQTQLGHARMYGEAMKLERLIQVTRDATSVTIGYEAPVTDA